MCRQGSFNSYQWFDKLKSWEKTEAVRRCYVRKSVFINFAKSTGKHLCQSLFLNKVAGLKRDSNTGVSCESFELFRNTYVEEHPPTAASIYWLGIGITCKKIFCYMRDSCYSVQVVYCLLKKRLWHKCFPVNLVKFLRTLFFYRAPLVAASCIFTSLD